MDWNKELRDFAFFAAIPFTILFICMSFAGLLWLTFLPLCVCAAILRSCSPWKIKFPVSGTHTYDNRVAVHVQNLYVDRTGKTEAKGVRVLKCGESSNESTGI